MPVAVVAASRTGLAEDEIVDLLSTDESLRAAVQSEAAHELPGDGTGRLPVVFWSRLYFDLAPYLTLRTTEGVAVLDFYHRELAEAARERYVAGEEGAHHRMLAAYFRTRTDPTGGRVWDAYPRGLAELTYHLAQAAQFDEASRQELFTTLTDFAFIERKVADVGRVITRAANRGEAVTHNGVFHLQDDYTRALALYPQAGRSRVEPLIRTAQRKDNALRVFCPACGESFDVSEAELGKTIICRGGNCEQKLRLNEFTVIVDQKRESRSLKSFLRP